MEEKVKSVLADLGLILCSFRWQAGMSQRTAASKIGSTQARISDIEQGRTDMHISTLIKWAALYGYDVEISFIPIENSQETPTL